MTSPHLPRGIVRIVLALVALLAAGLVAGLAGGLGSAWAGDGSASPSAAGKIILRLGWTSDPDNLNPFIGYESSSYEIWTLNYDQLVGFDPETWTPKRGAGLATDWQASADGKTWTFTITDKAVWQDGEPLTAADVAFTYNYIIDNEMGMFIDYVNGIDKVEAPDATTVIVTCSKPKANMLGLWIPILPEHIWSKIDPANAAETFKNSPPIVGSGPFQTVEWRKGEYVRLEANEDYWKGAPKVDEVIIQTYQNQDTMAQDLKSGAIQSGWNIPAAQCDALDAEEDLSSVRGVTLGFHELGFNCADKKIYPKSTGHPALTDAAFRKALQWAIDKDKIVAIAYNGDADPADTIIARDFYSDSADYHWSPPAEQAYSFDLDKARQALEMAGYTDGDGNGVREYKGKDIELTLYARTESPESQSAGKLITGWFRDIGLDVTLQVIDDGALGDKQYNYEGDEYAPDFDMFIWSWTSDIDPNFSLSVMTTGQIESWSDCNWSNQEYDRLFLQQQTELDTQKRIETVHRMQEIVYEESPYIPLVYAKDLETADTSTWTGWCRSSEGKGTWWFNGATDTYLAVHPGDTAKASDGGSNAALVVGIVVVVIAALIAWLLLRRRGGRREMEA